MPQAIPLIAEIIAGVAGATTIGTTIYGLENQPSVPKPVTPTPAQTAATAAKTQQTQEAALQQQFPGIQAATGGSLSPEAWIRLSELLSSQAGDPGIGSAAQDLLKKIFGSSGGGNFSVVSGVGTGGGTGSSGLTPAGSSYAA